ncbi:hypothetical protein BCD48_24980 [Pseudofrankia sp. BMG5.36]|nr:hypothetical protein BCD48_24980 [Pseudofrankia sp. BMG5.36]
MYWWSPGYPHKKNFGDEISPLLITEIFDRPCQPSAPDRCEIVAAGSIVELVLGMKRANRPILWGTGFMREEDNHITGNDFEVVAVRGSRSRERVKDNRDAVTLGDPGLLADALLTSSPVRKHRLGVLPHFLDAEIAELDWLRAQDGVHIIDATWEPRRVVAEIAACETLISSSLHGLIVADSVGVPNGHIRLSDNKFIGGMYKFRDYYSVFADPARHFTLSAGEVLGLGVAGTAAHVRQRYRVPADLPALKESLIKSFPLA